MLILALCVDLLPQVPAPAAGAPVVTAVTPAPRDLAAILAREPACAAVLAARAEHRLQVLLGEPVERDDGSIGLVHSQLGDERQYFYPASSIKLCGAVAALLRLAEHNRVHGTALGLDSPLVIEPRFPGDARIDADPGNVDGGVLTVGHALRKLFLVSDNAAYNHCLELCGQRELNERMWAAGFGSVRLWHRLSEVRTLEENRQTRAVRVGDAHFPAREAGAELANDAFRDLDIGEQHVVGEQRVAGAMSFARKNAITLRDLQHLLVEVVRPEIDTGKRGFPELGVAARAFVVQALGELPSESRNPRFDAARVPDHACKFVLRGVRDVVPAEHLRVFDKIGRAYGFSIENAYVEDTRTGRGFFLAIVLFTDADGVIGDGAYEYENVAAPFLDAAGRAIARAVLDGPPAPR